MPAHAEKAIEEIVATHDQKISDKATLTIEPMHWTAEANVLLNTINDQSLRDNLKMRAEKMARTEKSNTVETKHIAAFIEDPQNETLDTLEQTELHWDAAAIARLMRAPEGFMRDMSKARIEEYAREHNQTGITLEIAEQGLAVARKAMEETMSKGRSGKAPRLSKCPFTNFGNMSADEHAIEEGKRIPWSEGAKAYLANIPEGYCREMTRTAIETIAARSKLEQINEDFVDQLMQVFASGSSQIKETLPWDEEARERIAKAPVMIRGMLIKEIEGWASRQQLDRIDKTAVDAVKAEWGKRGVFHLDPDDPRNN